MWPRQSIRFVVPFAPGGTSEIVARTVANELTRQLGQTVYVENKGGGAGIPAMQDVAHATPDGHTIILGHVGSLAVNPSTWYGILAPAGTPPEIVRRLQEESLKALKSNSVTERFASDSAVGGGGPPEEFARFIAQQQKVWKDVVVRAGVKAD